MSKFTPTDQQQAIYTAVATGESVIVEAGAGTGKTTTLIDIAANEAPRKGILLCFNKSTAEDAAARAPKNLACKTLHKQAFGAICFGKKYIDKFNKRRFKNTEIARILGLTRTLDFGDDKSLDPKGQASLVKRTVDRFCDSGDFEIAAHHVPRVEGGEDHRAEIVSIILPAAQAYWKDLADLKGQFHFFHNHYLKLYQLDKPQLKADFIMLDEAQDSNGVTLDIIGRQKAQIILVGDRNQQIYGWRGAVDAMQSFDAAYRLPLTKSWRFGEIIATEGNKFLHVLESEINGEPFRITGHEAIDSKIDALDTPDAVLCRTNAGAVAEALLHLEAGHKVAIVGGAWDIVNFAKAAKVLMNNEASQGAYSEKVEHEDLMLFDSWSEVVKHSQTEEGESLRTLVKLIVNYGPDKIIALGDECSSEEDADVIVSTAHKAKGREWSKVRVANDFRVPEEGQSPSREELMLAYVVVTRAIDILDNSGLNWINRFA